MDATRARTVLPRFWKGVRRNHVQTQEGFTLACFDTETFHGKVFSLGFYDGDVFHHEHGLGKDYATIFLARVLALKGKGHRTMVVGAHYLVFDLGVLFWEYVNPSNRRTGKAPRHSHFSHLGLKCEVEIFWGKPCFARIRKDKRTISLVDTFAFFTMSLARALKMIKADFEKLPKPENLGKRLIPKTEIAPYLRNDVRGGYALLEHIESLHRQYGVRLCVSLPMLSGRVFRHFYVGQDFPRPRGALIRASMLAYHGGKNSFVARAGWHENCFDLDINSAYPEAMSQLPNFEGGRWEYGKGLAFFRSYPHGIYRVSGTLSACRWGVLFSHDFKKLEGEISKIWVTGYEINEAIRSGELEISDIRGFGFHEIRKHDRNSNAFSKFVSEFYRLKSEAESETEKYFYKLILNSLYGKFVARTEDDETGEMVAGSMFDPSIGSLITGFVRAKIHRLEHKYKALHTATDGIITKIRPDPADCGTEIGKLKEGTFGRVLILRNKLYLFFDQFGKLSKSGLHGFEGSPIELERIWKSSKRIYHVSRLTKWAESWHLGLPPGTERRIEKVLNVC